MKELSHRCILVVDDDSVLREIISQSFISMGYEVLKAENGIKALEALKNVRVDAIVCDIEMPEMDGLQFFEELRTQSVDIPVVIITGTDDKDRILTALRLGALDFIQKPFRPEELHPVIDRAVEIGVRRSRLHYRNFEGALNSAIGEQKIVGMVTSSTHKKRSAS